MGKGDGLTFGALTGASIARLPEFKNRHGGLAHSKADGSDWSPSQWLQAVIGELGEFASFRVAFEAGELTFEEYKEKAAKELADVQCYLAILAKRCLDDNRKPSGANVATPARELMSLLSALGEWANTRKKFERGDLTRAEYLPESASYLSSVNASLSFLKVAADFDPVTLHIVAHPEGVDLGRATIDKFNAISERVGSSVRIAEMGRAWYEGKDGWHGDLTPR